MKPLRTVAHRALVALICLTLAFGSVLPDLNHSAAVVEAAQQQADMDHDHGLIHDLYKLLHGHSYDTTDHDHGQAFSVFGEGASFPPPCQDLCREPLSLPLQFSLFRIERPPRA